LAVASTVSGKHIARGADLAALDFETLNQVNGALVFGSTNGSFTFSPTVDGGYVPDHPDRLLLEGHFNPDVDLMVGHNANEAGLFVSPDVDTEEELLSALSHFFENFRKESVDYILTELYPPPSESDGAYATNYERATHIVSEASFVCHTRALAKAFGNQTWNYRFEVPPAVHAQDVPWTFFHGNGSDVVNKELAQTMQLYFTSFAMTADPNNEGSLPQWPEYGDEARIATFGINGVGDDVDDAKNKRCDFWQRGEYRK
jgi:carboxylesterase type B